MTEPLSVAGTRLRGLMRSGKPVVAPGVFDPFTARIIQNAGFEALYLGGNAIGLGLGIGQPLITLTETVDLAARIRRVTDLPLIVDAETGFGDVIHVRRTVLDLTSLGVAAIHIDDQPYPKRASYHRGESQVVDIEIAAQRFHAASDARAGTGCLLIARIDSYRTSGSLADTIRRARAFRQAGADVVLLLDVPLDELSVVRAEVPDTPIAVYAAYREAGPSVEELAGAGVSLALYPLATAAAISEAVQACWTHFHHTGMVGLSDETIRHQRQAMQHIIGMDRNWELEEQRG